MLPGETRVRTVASHLTAGPQISLCGIGASVAAAALCVDSEILPSIIGGWQGVGSEHRGNTCLLVLTAEDLGDVKQHRLGKSRQKSQLQTHLN